MGKKYIEVTKKEKSIMKYLTKNYRGMVTYKELHKNTGIAYDALKRTLSNLEKKDLITIRRAEYYTNGLRQFKQFVSLADDALKIKVYCKRSLRGLLERSKKRRVYKKLLSE